MILYTKKHRIPFQIDEEDQSKIIYYTWRQNACGYIVSGVECIRLHDLIMGYAPYPLEWDHKNRIRSDNRKENLRLVTHSVNMRNTDIKNPLGYPGIYLNPLERGKEYVAFIRKDGKQFNLGYFDTVDEAIIARKAAEIKLGVENDRC